MITYRTLHIKTAEHPFFSRTHEIFTEITGPLGILANFKGLNKYRSCSLTTV